MSNDGSIDDFDGIAAAVADVAAEGTRVVAALLGVEPKASSPAALQRSDAANYARTPEGDSAVAGAQEQIIWSTLAALGHAEAFAALIRGGHSISPAVLARAGVEALGIAWQHLSAPDVRTLLERNINIRRAELYFPSKHGVLVEDVDGTSRPALQTRMELAELLKERGFTEERVHVHELAAAVIDAALGSGGAAHYSQLSTIAHAALPAVAIHMTGERLSPSRELVITAAVDLVAPLIRVVEALTELFDVHDQRWARAALDAVDTLNGYNTQLPERPEPDREDTVAP